MTARIPQPTPEELANWRRLASLVVEAVASPRKPNPALAAARKRTKNNVVPNGPPTREHPFVRLARTADRFLSETAAGREDLAAEFGALGALCLARLDQPARAVRPRADLDDAE